MSDKTSIEWTATYHEDGSVTPGATWNPIRGAGDNRWMCRKTSPGCDYCYASRLNKRFGGAEYAAAGTALMVTDSPGSDARGDFIRLDERALTQPLRWKQPRMIFVCSMTDLFGEWVPDDWIRRIFQVMRDCPQHTFQVLTKRPARMKAICDTDLEWYRATGQCPERRYLPNVWLGVSVELDRYAWRVKILSEIPAAVRFVSAEPLLGPLPSLELAKPCTASDCDGGVVWPPEGEDLEPPLDEPGANTLCATCHGSGWTDPLIDWLITGGESGGPPERRLVQPCDVSDYDADGKLLGCWMPPKGCGHCNMTGWQPKPQVSAWARDLRDRSKAVGVAFHFKQWGGPTPKAGGRLLDGREWNEMPNVFAEDRR